MCGVGLAVQSFPTCCRCVFSVHAVLELRCREREWRWIRNTIGVKNLSNVVDMMMETWIDSGWPPPGFL